MSLLQKIEKACSRCGGTEWRPDKKAELCAGCGKKRSVSNYISRVGGIDETTGTRVKALALAKDAKRRIAYGEEGVKALYRPKSMPTLGEWSKVFLEFVRETHDLKESTKEDYRGDVKLLEGSKVWKLKLNQIGPADVSVLSFKGGNSTANHAIRILHRMLTFAAEKDWLKAVPTFKLRTENKRRAVILAGAQEDALLALAGPVLRDFLVIMLDCGMRPGEIARMRWEHVKWADKVIFVPFGKTFAATRHVPLSDRMAEALRARKGKGEWVFPSRRDAGYISHEAVSQRFRDTCAAYKGEPALQSGLVLYSARHSFPGRFLRAGGDKAALKEIMGHASLSTTDIYVHGNVTDAAAIMDRFNSERTKVLRMEKRA